MKKYLYILLCLFSALCLASCSEKEEVDTEFENWESRNSQFFEQVYQTAQSNISHGKSEWKILRSYAKDPSVEGVHTEYVVARVLSSSGKTEIPEYSDSVRVHYRGYLMPSASYNYALYGTSVGRQFDSSWYGSTFDATTAVPAKFSVGTSLIEGFSTVLQHMPVGDRWLVYIPCQMAYGSSPSGKVVAYSTLIFDIQLAAFGKPGIPMPPYY